MYLKDTIIKEKLDIYIHTHIDNVNSSKKK